jgi:hypothetical protein
MGRISMVKTMSIGSINTLLCLFRNKEYIITKDLSDRNLILP